MNTFSNYDYISEGRDERGKEINPRQIYTLREGGTLNQGDDAIILKFVVPYNYIYESDYQRALNMLGKNVSNFEAKGDVYSQNHFSKSYLGSSHTTQGDSFTEIFAGVSNVLGQTMAGKDDVASSLYTILTRSMSKISVLNESANFIDNTNNQQQSQQTQAVTDLKGFTNYSGAAIGTDKYFEQEFIKQGGRQVNFVVDNLKALTAEQNKEVEDAYLKAVKDLGRMPLSYDWLNPDKIVNDKKVYYSGGLVRRDYLQAKSADSIFAISTIIEPGMKDKKGYVNKTNQQKVEGGTGYGVQMGINLGKIVYVFDQLKNQWFVWNNDKFIETQIPMLTKKFAGIGTREINENGKKAIRDVISNSLIKPEQESGTTDFKVCDGL